MKLQLIILTLILCTLTACSGSIFGNPKITDYVYGYDTGQSMMHVYLKNNKDTTIYCIPNDNQDALSTIKNALRERSEVTIEYTDVPPEMKCEGRENTKLVVTIT